MDVDGELAGENARLAGGSGEQQAPAVGYSPAAGEWLVLWEEQAADNWNLRLRRVGADGALLAAATVLSATADQRAVALSEAEDGLPHLVAWQDDRNGNWDLYAAQFAPLLAGFTATPPYGLPPLEVQFGDASTPAGAADAWCWAFGDGGGSSVQEPTHTYTATGLNCNQKRNHTRMVFVLYYLAVREPA